MENKEVRETEFVRVMGAGGVGFWLTVALARDLDPSIKIIVYDDDNFEGGMGARRLPWVSNPQMKKVDFLRGFVRMAMGDSPPFVVGERLSSNIVEGWTDEEAEKSIVVDASDMEMRGRKLIWDAFEARNIRRMRVSYDGLGIVTVSHGLPLCKPEAKGGYVLVPSLSQSLRAAGMGAETVRRFVEEGSFEALNIKI